MSREEDALDDALDALEMMVQQYLSGDGVWGRHYYHDHMAAGEFACEVLARLRPDRWLETPVGVIYFGHRPRVEE